MLWCSSQRWDFSDGRTIHSWFGMWLKLEVYFIFSTKNMVSFVSQIIVHHKEHFLSILNFYFSILLCWRLCKDKSKIWFADPFHSVPWNIFCVKIKCTYYFRDEIFFFDFHIPNYSTSRNILRGSMYSSWR